jgi:hypothetical protein
MFNNFSRKSCSLLHNVEKYVTAGQATDDNIKVRMRFGCWIFKRYRHTLTVSNIYCSATAAMEVWTCLNIRLICTLLVLLLACLEFTQNVVPCRFWVQRSRTYVFKWHDGVQKKPTGDMLNLGCFKELLKKTTHCNGNATRINLVTFYLTNTLTSSCRLDNPPLYLHVIEQNLVCPYAKTYLASPAGSV